VIRRLVPGDERLLQTITQRNKEFVPDDAWAAAFLADGRNCILVELAAGLPVGFVLLYLLPRFDGCIGAFLYELGVDEGFRRRGIGRGLIEDAKRVARAAGAFELYVLTEPENEAANALYAVTGAEGPQTSVIWTWVL
jgi:ribosomal protein S18 acetylase RimI-like enzyme